MRKTTIYLIRHGQSIGNQKRLYLGHTDMDLSELGYKQAAETASYLSDINFDAIYSSDLLRAYNTALPHAKMRNMQVIPSIELRELWLGDWDGRHIDDLLTNEKEAFVEGWQKNFGTFTPPRGESVWGGGVRFEREVKRIASNNLGKTILIAAHAAVIRAFWGIISGAEPSQLASMCEFPTNASFSTLEYDGERLIPIKYSCDEHLTEKSGIAGSKIKENK